MTAAASSIVLFYKYFLPESFPILAKGDENSQQYAIQLFEFLKNICHQHALKGRLLVSSEGVNGTLSASSPESIQDFIEEVEDFDLLRDLPSPPSQKQLVASTDDYHIFRDIDWKTSTNSHEEIIEPFPDLKVSLVKEIISSGGAVSVNDLHMTGQHLSPTEFHEILSRPDNKDVVLIDVRNTFEYDIGHFVNPHTQEHAMNPKLTTFSHFDSTFCAPKSDELKNKQVLMYCTGGIRCEKASVMLKQRGVSNVSQLKGGIHRYLEEFGDKGFFRGRNFVFDQRVSMTPAECYIEKNEGEEKDASLDLYSIQQETTREAVIGKCVECEAPFDELCGSRVCTVCRDLVLVCPKCEAKLPEYHCDRHISWRKCYFTFLNRYSICELQAQKELIKELMDSEYVPASEHRNVRKTLSKQMTKLAERIKDIQSGTATVDRNAQRRCRTCMELRTICDGRCWGFWKRKVSLTVQDEQLEPILPISIGDKVEPGPQWNELRLGPKRQKIGTVQEIKSWCSGGPGDDCIVVQWDSSDDQSSIQIYRWGTLALNGNRMYDLRVVR